MLMREGLQYAWCELRLWWASVLLGWLTTTVPNDRQRAISGLREVAFGLWEDDDDFDYD